MKICKRSGETTRIWLLKPTQISQEKLPVEICNVGLSPVILSLQPYDTNNRLSSSLMGEMRSGDRRLVSQGWWKEWTGAEAVRYFLSFAEIIFN